MRTAEIVATGSELLGPDRLDTNSLWLTRQLEACGLQVLRKTVVGDDQAQLQEVLEGALGRVDLVVCTGGLGPTRDDVTREAASAATGRPLRARQELEEELRRRFEARGAVMSDNNLRQAQVPEGARVLLNRVGTAPGLELQGPRSRLWLLPGPPRELEPMFSELLRPELEARGAGRRRVRRVLKVFGLPESLMDQLIAPVCARCPEVEVTVNFTAWDLQLLLTAEEETAEERLEALTGLLRGVLGEHLYAAGGESMEEIVLASLSGRSLAVVEGVTAGHVASRLGRGLVGAWIGLAAGRSLRAREEVLEAGGRIRRELGAELALVVGDPVGQEGEPAEVWVGLVSAGRSLAERLRLPAPGREFAARASQAVLDHLRRWLAAGAG